MADSNLDPRAQEFMPIPILPSSYSYPFSYSVSPTRSLLITSVHSSFLRCEANLRRILRTFGDIRAFQTDTLPYGFVTVHYYNLTHAETALSAIRNLYFQQYHLVSELPSWAYYIVPSSHAPSLPDPQNQGTIVIFNLDRAVSPHVLRQSLQRYGPIKECRYTPKKWNHRFVEFYDVRDAAKALEEMNGREIAGKTVLIEFSRPGGRVRNLFNAAGTTSSLLHPTLPLPSPPSSRPTRTHENGNQESRDNDSQFQIKDDGNLESSSRDSRTTVMIKNIPNKYSLELLLDMLDKHCIQCNERIGENDDQPLSSYDFVYLRIDFEHKCNKGYGFVNMTSPEAALRLHKALHGQGWERFNSRKICEITYAKIQGLEALTEKFKNSKLPREDYMPVVFRPARDGRRVTTPLPIVHYQQQQVQQMLSNSDEMKASSSKSDAGADNQHNNSSNDAVDNKGSASGEFISRWAYVMMPRDS